MKKVLLVIAGIIIGFIFSLVISGKTLKAEEPDLEERVSTVRHGYGVYLQFEYEIIDSSYGSFVVIKPRNGGQIDFHVAGIKP